MVRHAVTVVSNYDLIAFKDNIHAISICIERVFHQLENRNLVVGNKVAAQHTFQTGANIKVKLFQILALQK